MRRCEKSSSFVEESVDDPVDNPELVNDLSPVLKWVRSLGLAKYEDVFLREEIDWDTLQSLTEEVWHKNLISTFTTMMRMESYVLTFLHLLGIGSPEHRYYVTWP